MKNLLFLTLAITICFITACKKENPTSIAGHVLEFDTNKPIEGALIYLYGGDSDGNFSNPGAYLEKIDSTISDADGSYHFDLDASPYPILDLIAHKELYFSEDVLQGIYRTKDNQIDIVLDPHSWLELHIKNDMPVDEGDFIATAGVAGGESFGGEDVNETYIIKIHGNKEHKITWQVIKSGNQNTYQEFIYVPAHDTTTFEIFY